MICNICISQDHLQSWFAEFAPEGPRSHLKKTKMFRPRQVPRISYNTLLDWYVLICWAFLLLMVLGNCFVHHDAKTAVGFTFGFSAWIKVQKGGSLAGDGWLGLGIFGGWWGWIYQAILLSVFGLFWFCIKGISKRERGKSSGCKPFLGSLSSLFPTLDWCWCRSQCWRHIDHHLVWGQRPTPRCALCIL